MEESLNLKPKEIKDFTKIINEYIALQTSSSLSTLLAEQITYKVMILDKKYFNPKNIRLSTNELPMCGVRLRGKGDIHIEIFNAMSIGTGFRVDLSTPDYMQGDLTSMVNDSTKDVIKSSESAIIADTELVGEKSGIRIHMIIVQNSGDARKLLTKNGKDNSSEFSSIVDSRKYSTCSENKELDSLIEELQKEAN